jgi:hypothetical protein
MNTPPGRTEAVIPARAQGGGWWMSAPGAAAARAGAIALLLAAAVSLGPAALRASAAPWGAVIECLAPDLRVMALGPARIDGAEVVQAEVTLARTVYLGGRMQAPNPAGRAQAQVPASQPLQGPLLALALALGWPLARPMAGSVAASVSASVSPSRAGRIVEPAVRAAAALPLAALLWCVDTPLALAASLWRLVLQAMAPGQGSPLVAAADLMTDGGRLALGAAAGLAAVAVGRWADARRHGRDTRRA